MRQAETRDLANLSLPPLRGTARESAALQAMANSWDWPVKTYLGVDATEVQLRAARSPRILHLATHGFFLPDTEAEGVKVREGAFRDTGPLLHFCKRGCSGPLTLQPRLSTPEQSGDSGHLRMRAFGISVFYVLHADVFGHKFSLAKSRVAAARESHSDMLNLTCTKCTSEGFWITGRWFGF
jgi:hypothetical protein